MAATDLLLVASWGIASGFAVALLGVFSLMGRRARPRGGFAFGLFALAWGMQVALGNMGGLIESPQTASRVFLGFIAASLPVSYFLVEFAASQATRHRAAWTALRWTYAALALAGAGVLALEPALLYRGLQAGGGGPASVLGPVYLPLVALPQFTAFALAMLALYDAKRRAPTPRTAERSAFMLAGLGLYVGFAAGNNLAYYVGAMLLYPDPLNAPYAATFGMLSAVALSILGASVVHARAARREDGAPKRLVAWAIGAPFAWGVVEAALALGPIPRLDTVGLWRLAAVAVLAYGLARWRLYDLPQRAAKAAASAGGAAAAVAGGATAYGAALLVTSGPVVPAAAGALVVLATLAPGVRFARALLERARRKAGGGLADDAYGQRLEAYRAALEASLARGTLDEDEAFLAALRERFAIDASEHRVLLHYARSSVILGATGADAEGAYERLRLLGEGGAGRTWLARDRLHDRLVVLKEPLERWHRDATLREAVMREARLTARVRHPHVVQIHDVVEHKGAPILVMEYVEGGSLADLLRRRGALPWRDAVRLARGMLQGVDAVHAAGIVHRDLKPSNVLLTAEGEPKVADFGIAIPTTSGKTIIDAGTTFAGTVSYMAPEVRAGAVGDRRSDVYACGAILHECVYGAPPGHAVATPGDLPVALESLLSRTLSPIPERRPPTARALAEELTMLVP